MPKLPLIVFVCLLAACAATPEIVPTASLPPTLTATATRTATPLPSPRPSVMPSPTPLLLRFGLWQGMTIAECNKLVMNKDGTIPDEYLKQERAWVAANRPPFKDIIGWARAPGNTVAPGEFPLSMYKLISRGPKEKPQSKLPEQSLVGCAILEDGTFVLSMVVRPPYMSDIANVTPETVPIFHIALTQSGIDFVNTHSGLKNVVSMYRNSSLVPNISEIISVLTNQEVLARHTYFNIFTIRVSENTDIDKLDPSLQSLKNIMWANSSYVGNWTEQELIGSEGQGSGILKTDIFLFMSEDSAKVERGKQISTRLIPALAISIEFGE